LIKKRDFIHQNIKYSFNWNIRNYLEKMNQLDTNREELKKLGTYLKHIYEGSVVPNDIFNTKNIPRVSQFKIRGLKNAFLNSLSKKLIRAGKIKKYDSNSKFPRYVQKVYESYNKNQITRKPGHDSVLKNILIKDKDSIAIEVPIWNKINNSYITGHIDLIQIKDHVIKIIDYKPEGNFLFSLPQVATYGFLVKKALKLKHLKCLSFNNEEVWEYDPNILLTDIKQYLISHKIIKRSWELFL